MMNYTAQRARLLAATLLMVASPAFAQSDAAASRRDGDIVVTARSLDDTERALRECIARRCPPDQDIAASAAHAENQFVAGDYRAARRTLNASVGRNRGADLRYAEPLAGLFRANARVAAHLGEGNSYRINVLDGRDTLVRAFGEQDPRALIAQVEVGDSRARLGFVEEARRIYRDVARNAATSAPRVAAFADLRLAASLLSEGAGVPANERRASLARLDEIADAAPQVGRDLALVATVQRLRAARDSNDTARIASLVDRLGRERFTRPVLLNATALPLHPTGVIASPSSAAASGRLGGFREKALGDVVISNGVLTRSQSYNVESRWVDVGFWVERDGRVREVEVLRAEGPTGWANELRRSIMARQYAPFVGLGDATAGSGGAYLVERYTLTADWNDDCTDTRMRCREPLLRIERLDLTAPEGSSRVASAR